MTPHADVTNSIWRHIRDSDSYHSFYKMTTAHECKTISLQYTKTTTCPLWTKLLQYGVSDCCIIGLSKIDYYFVWVKTGCPS
jgi:hypothetical protein